MTLTDNEHRTLQLVAHYLERFPSARRGLLEDLSRACSANEDLVKRICQRPSWDGSIQDVPLDTAIALPGIGRAQRLEHIVAQCTAVSQFQQRGVALIKRDPIVAGPAAAVGGIVGSLRNTGNLTALQFLRTMELGVIYRQPLAPDREIYFPMMIEERTAVKGHIAATYNGICDRTGSVFITAGDDGLVKLWDSASGYLMRSLRGHCTHKLRDGVVENIYVMQDVSISVDNSMLATASLDGTVTLWNTTNWEPITTLKVMKDITTIKISPATAKDLSCVLVTCKDGKSRLFYRSEDNFHSLPFILDTHKRRNDMTSCSSFNYTGTKFVVGGTDGVYVYRLSSRSGKDIPDECLPYAEPTPNSSPQAPFHIIHVYRATAHHPATGNRKSRFSSSILSLPEVEFGNYSDSFASCCFDGTICLFVFDKALGTWTKHELENPMRTGTIQKTRYDIIENFVTTDDNDESTEDSYRAAYALSWNCADGLLAVSSGMGFILIFDVKSRKLIRILAEHANVVFILNFHPKVPHILMSAGHDGFLMLWDVKSGKCLKRFDIGYAILSATFSPDGTAIYANDMEGCQYFYGIGELDRIYPCFEQFFAADFQYVVRQQDGTLLDTTSNTAPHLVPLGDLVDSRLSPYFIPQRKLREMYNLDRGFDTTSQAIVDELERRSRALKEELDSKVPVVLPSGLRATNSFVEPQTDIVDYIDPLGLPPAPPSSGNGSQYSDSKASSSEDEDDEEDEGDDDDDDDDSGSDYSDKSFRKKTTPSLRRRDKNRNAQSSSSKKAAYSTRRRSHKRRKSRSDESDTFIVDTDEEDNVPSRPVRSTRARRVRTVFSDDSASESSLSSEIDIEESDSQPRRSSRGKAPLVNKKNKKSDSRAPKKARVQIVATDYTQPDPWLVQVEPHGQFLPQVGDILLYSKTGHSKFNEIATKQGYSIKTDVDETLPISVFCKVEDIKFFAEEIISCVVELRVVEIKEAVDYDRIPSDAVQLVKRKGKSLAFSVHMWDLAGVPDFFVTLRQYHYCAAQELQVGYSVQAKFDEKFWTGEIVKEKTGSDPYEKFQVLWEGGNSDWLSPWELYIIPPKSPNFSSMRRSFTRIVKGIIARYLGDSDIGKYFRDPVDYLSYPDYLLINPYPVWLRLILERLSKQYYRTKSAVVWDVRMMIDNAKRYNEPDSLLHGLAAGELTAMCSEISEVEE